MSRYTGGRAAVYVPISTVRRLIDALSRDVGIEIRECAEPQLIVKRRKAAGNAQFTRVGKA